MHRLIFVLPPLIGLAAGTVLSLPLGIPRKPLWLLVAAIYFVLDAAVTLEAPHVPGTHWNWAGKAGAAILALVAARALRMSRAEFGLVMPRGKRAWAATVAGIMITGAIGFLANYAFRDHQPHSTETLLFEASLPGLAEEMNYRGILFVLMQRAFVSRDSWRQNLPAVIIPTLVFAFGHGFSPDNGGLALAWVPFAFSFLIGFALAIIRLLSASLVSAIVAHNVTNVLGDVASGLP